MPIESILKAFGFQSKELTDSQRLAIAEEVDRRLKSLPVETYQLIEKMVKQRVEDREKWYRWVFIVVLVALGVVSSTFYKVTADNAGEKVTEMLARSEAAKKIEELNRFYQQGLTRINEVTVTANEITNIAARLKIRIKELDTIDNLVRYSSDGNLYFKSADGAIWLERRDGTGPKGFIRLFQADNFITTEIGPYVIGTTP